jgi:dipeptidase
MTPAALQLLAVFSLAWLPSAAPCTTSVVGRAATVDGSVLASHSNDGDGGIAGNLIKVPPQTRTHNSGTRGNNAAASSFSRALRGGGRIPDIANTFGYLTKPGGYASLNDQGVALAESTCSAVFAGNKSTGAQLDIVDLSELGLERASSARQAVQVMGGLAEQYGYYDAGESLLVSDATEAWIFHILPDHTGTSAIWVRLCVCACAALVFV